MTLGRREITSAAVALTMLFLVLAGLVVGHLGALDRFDVSVADGLNRAVAGDPPAVTFWKVITYGLQPLTWEVLGSATALAIGLRTRSWRLPLFVLVAIFGTLGWYDLVKAVVGRPRPVVPMPLLHPAGSSFPSGHAMMSETAAGIACVLAWARWSRPRPRAVVAVVAGVVAVTVAASRLVLGAHYLSDVVGGWLLGAAWLLGLSAAFDVPGLRLSRSGASGGPRASDRPRTRRAA